VVAIVAENGKMPLEAYCQHCDSFQPLASEDRNLICRHCGFLIARSNPIDEMYCDSCDEYTPALHEPVSPPLPDDVGNLGYVLGDIICPDCYSIIVTLRESA